MTEHKLKTWPDPFESVWVGHKKHELRQDDRAFEVGDELLLQEWDPTTNQYSGRYIRARVTYISRPGPFPGLVEGFCVMSIEPYDQGRVSCVG